MKSKFSSFLGWVLVFCPILFIFAAAFGGGKLLQLFKSLYNILFYVFIFLLMLEDQNLDEYNFDTTTIVAIILFGFFRSRYFRGSFDIYYRVAFAVITVGIIVVIILRKPKIPKTNSRWFFISIFAALLISIPVSLIGTLQSNEWVYNNPYPHGIFWGAVIGLITNFSLVVILEETLFRGFVWGQFLKRGWSEKKTFLVQAGLFWLIHIWQIFTLPAFFIAQPIVIFLLSFLRRYSKQLFPSIIAHALINTLVSILIYIYLR